MSNDHPRLLIIDDQPESVSLLLSFLSEQELDILVALDGADGLQKAVQGMPDLILLDVSMPGMDGFAVCAALKADVATASIPVLFLTASSMVEDKLAGFAVGAADYITKPFSEEEVVARVFIHLHAKKRIDRLEAIAVQRAVERATTGLSHDDVLFANTLALLENHLDEPLTLEEIAVRVGSNDRKLTELFRKRVSMSVFDYFVDLRLETSRRLLVGSDVQIQLIAFQIGYKNAGDFTRAFRQRYGVGPKEYRLTQKSPGAGKK